MKTIYLSVMLHTCAASGFLHSSPGGRALRPQQPARVHELPPLEDDPALRRHPPNASRGPMLP